MNGEESSKPPTSKKGKLNIEDEETILPAKIDPEAKTESGMEADLKRLMESESPPIRSMMLQMTRMHGGGPFPHPIFDKMTAEHVDKFLDHSHEDEINEYTLARLNKWFHLGYALLFVAFLVFLILYLAPFQKDLLGDILKMLAVFAGGFGAGFGAKSFWGKRE